MDRPETTSPTASTMLSIGKLGVAGGADYYLDKMANSVDDYYLGRGEAPGQWVGQTAAGLGLVGQVDPEDLRNLLAGRSADGETLGVQCPAGSTPRLRPHLLGAEGRVAALGVRRGRRSRRHLGRPTTGRSALGDRSPLGRGLLRPARPGGRQLIEANGFIGAAFRHRTSRAGDPQLHTHVVVPNLVQGADGRWSAPDGRQLYLGRRPPAPSTGPHCGPSWHPSGSPGISAATD